MTSSNTAFAGILLRVSTQPALRLMAPAILIVMVVAAGLHGESTLTFQELGDLYERGPRLRSTIVALWVLVIAPAARASVMAPGLSYLRWLPLPTWLIQVHYLVLLFVLGVLPVIPFFVAGYPAHGIGMLLALTGLSACLMPGSRHLGDALIRAGGIAALGWCVHEGAWLPAIAVGATVTLVRIARVWRLAPEHSHWQGGPRLVFGGRVFAITCAQLLHVWRRESAALSRALLVSTLGVFLIYLIARANQGSITEGGLLVATTPTLAAVSIMLALVLKRSRRDLDWLMRSLGVQRATERLVSVGLIFVAGAMLVTLSTVVANASALHGLVCGIHALAWALLALAISSRSQEDVRSASIALAIAFFSMFAIGLGGRAPLGAEVGLGLLAIGPLLIRDTSDA